MKGSWQIVVHRPIADVFDFLADIRNETAWNPRVIHIDQVSAGPIGRDTVFRGRYQALGTLETTLTAYERPTRLSFRSAGPRLHLSGTFTLAPDPSGTRITLSADLHPQGVFGVLAPVMNPLVKRQNAIAATRLKQVLDDGRAALTGRTTGRTEGW
jgi:hypothetical protein